MAADAQQQTHEINCRVRAARDLLNGVLEQRVTLSAVGDGAIALVSRAMAIAEGDWDSLLPDEPAGEQT